MPKLWSHLTFRSHPIRTGRSGTPDIPTIATNVYQSGLLAENSNAVFHACYSALDTPVCLCNGLEIVAVNPALAHLLKRPASELTGRMLDRLGWQSPLDEELLANSVLKFECPILCPNQHEPYTIRVDGSAWPYDSRLTLLEWTDCTQDIQLKTKLANARDCDGTTGHLLPHAFMRKADHIFACDKAKNLQQLLVRLTITSQSGAPITLPREESDDLILSLGQHISDDFGGSTLVAREDLLSILLLLPFDNSTNVQRHLLRQLERIAKQHCDATSRSGHALSFRVWVAQYPNHGARFEGLMNALNTLSNTPTDFLDGCEKSAVYSPQIAEQAERRRQLAHDLGPAIAANEVSPHYQPIIDSRTRRIKGFEALIRWTHAKHGYIIPPDIISIAIEQGLLFPLTQHIMEQAVAQIKDWPQDVSVAVNVTPSQLTGELVDMVRQTVRDALIDPERLEIEVTEDALFDDFHASARIISRLRAIGVRVAMDDFGAGYTSIGNLRRLEFNKIKIDKSISDGLPDDPRAVAIVRWLMGLASDLDVAITVEGIETDRQLNILAPFDCGIQGYVFSRPLPASELPNLHQYINHFPLDQDKPVAAAHSQNASSVVSIKRQKQHKGS